MKQYTYIRTLALMAIFAFAACGGDEYIEEPSFKDDIKEIIVEKSQLPQWLAEYVSYLEYIPEGQELPTEPSGIYRFSWKGRDFYEFYSPSQTMLHADLYKDDGTPVQLVESDYKSLTDSACNWTIIYLLQPGHQPSMDHVYPSEVHEYDTYLKNAMSYPRLFLFDVFKTEEYIYAINSEEQIKPEYRTTAILPPFDFSNYTLVIGRVPALKNVPLRRHEIVTEGKRATLRLYYDKKLQVDESIEKDSLELRPFWAFYPKMEVNELSQQLYINNQIKRSANVDITDPLFPENWDPSYDILPTACYYTAEEVNKLLWGRKWTLSQEFEILPDGHLLKNESGVYTHYNLIEDYFAESSYHQETNVLKLGERDSFILLSLDSCYMKVARLASEQNERKTYLFETYKSSPFDLVDEPLISENWEPTREKLSVISAEVFKQYSINKVWQPLWFGEILVDGRVCRIASRSSGFGIASYDFRDGHAIEDYYADNGGFQKEVNYSYDENTNELKIGNVTYYLLSINDYEMKLIRLSDRSIIRNFRNEKSYYILTFQIKTNWI